MAFDKALTRAWKPPGANGSWTEKGKFWSRKAIDGFTRQRDFVQLIFQRLDWKIGDIS